MRVQVLYFAAVRELLGDLDSEWLEVPEGADIARFRHVLLERHPDLASRMGHIRIARNEAFAIDDERLAEGDTLALIPPVAGG
jgi:molybdopterin converting factor subunit 1